MIALAWSGLLPLAGAIGRGDPLITLSSCDAIGLPIGLTLLAFAGLALTPMPETNPCQRRPRGGA